jgi:hypothetical protein
MFIFVLLDDLYYSRRFFLRKRRKLPVTRFFHVNHDVQLLKLFYPGEALFMKRITLIASIVMIVVGFISARIGDSLSTVSASGVVHDSILMPIGIILFVLGLLALAVASLWHLVDFIRGRLKKA